MQTLGRRPSGEYAASIRRSSNFRNGEFQNLSPTSAMAKGAFWRILFRFLNKPKNTVPPSVLPSMKTDLKSLNQPDANPVIVWFGHSSYFIRLNGINILVDPVLSGHASPFSFSVKSFPGADIYSVDDLPSIDMLILTHDHYDHLDYDTLPLLRPKVKNVYTALGVGAHLDHWGFPKEMITEFDWWDSKEISDGVRLTAAPARHFSGRTFKRNQALWCSFILKVANHNFYIGADSGYDTHFADIGRRFGPFDIAFLETGQYNDDWPLIHMTPEEAVQASLDLRARWMLPVHWGKFSLAFHPWSEPAERVRKKAAALGVSVTTPLIGEPVVLNKSYPRREWWMEV
jgi:L-ascorbate metabolism protein UlaG (beta-lactamase superfamily)